MTLGTGTRAEIACREHAAFSSYGVGHAHRIGGCSVAQSYPVHREMFTALKNFPMGGKTGRPGSVINIARLQGN